MGDAEILRIERGTWHCFVEFRSSENATELERKIEAWYANLRDEETARLEREHAVKCDAWVKKHLNDRPGIPAITTYPDGRRVEGYTFIDDSDEWQYVFPANPVQTG